MVTTIPQLAALVVEETASHLITRTSFEAKVLRDRGYAEIDDNSRVLQDAKSRKVYRVVTRAGVDQGRLDAPGCKALVEAYFLLQRELPTLEAWATYNATTTASNTPHGMRVLVERRYVKTDMSPWVRELLDAWVASKRS